MGTRIHWYNGYSGTPSQWFLSPSFFIYLNTWIIFLSSHLFLCYQSAQITHILGERLKELTEDAEREKALKDVANANVKEKGKATEAVEKKA